MMCVVVTERLLGTAKNKRPRQGEKESKRSQVGAKAYVYISSLSLPVLNDNQAHINYY